MNAPPVKSRKFIEPALSKADIFPLTGIIFLAVLVFAPMFFGRPAMPDTWTRFQPWNAELGYDGPLDERIVNSNNDTILLYIPWNAFAHRELNDGKVPAWDPYCLIGVPLAANHLVPVFYPVYALIAWLVSPLYILGISALVHTIIAGIFFYLFLKEWLGNRIAAWTMASCLVVSLILNPHYQPWPMTLAFFPAIWFFNERWLKHRSGWSGLWMALAWSVPLVSGYPSLVAQMSIFTAVWILVRPMGMEVSERPTVKSRLAILFLPFVMAVGLSAVQNIPTIMASVESDRTFFKSSEELSREAGFTIPAGEPWQVHAKRLLQPLIPYKFSGNDFFNRGHVGVIPVMFALMSIAWIRVKKYPLYALYLALIVAPFALIPALNFRLYSLTRGALIDPNPPVEVLGFLILMLAAVGFDRVSSPHRQDERIIHNPYKIIRIWTLFIAIFVMSVAMYFNARSHDSLVYEYFATPAFVVFLFFLNYAWEFISDRKKTIAVSVVLSLVFAMYALSVGDYFCPPNFVLPAKDSVPMRETNAISHIKNMIDESQENWGRIIRYHNEPVNVLSIDKQPYTFYPNLGTFFEIPDAFGYHNLAPKSRFDYFREIQNEAVVERRGIVCFTPTVDPFDRRLAMTGARYILSVEPVENLAPVYESDGLIIYMNPYAWRRVEFMPESEYAEKSYGEWTQQNVWMSELRMMNPDWPRIEVDKPGYIVINSDSDYVAEGRLIINEAFSPGWSASVDGEPVEIDLVNGLLMGIRLPESWNRIELKYEMPGLKIGWIITCTFIIIWLFLSVLITLKRPRRHPRIFAS
ncbi:MAG TPA: hypothetical protein ENN67_05200 [Firmicutes bacterium]|nr:hypothetical protein [Bacillota bacterium]